MTIKEIYDYTLSFEAAKCSPLWSLYKRDVSLMENRAGYEPTTNALKSHFDSFNFLRITTEWGRDGASGIEITVWARHHEGVCVHLITFSRLGEKTQKQEFVGEIAEKQMKVIMDNIVIPFHPDCVLFKI